MENLGYSFVSKSFLVKNVGEYEVNITRRNNMIDSLTGYQDNNIINLPEDIISEVRTDIQNSL